jgi:C4-dicarboxylate-specific signal transduction histidine kinase
MNSASGNPKDPLAAVLGTDRSATETGASWRRLSRAHSGAAMLQVAARFAHELNQPLTAIAVYAEGCQEMFEKGEFDLEEFKEAIDHMADLALRAGHSIQHLRQMVRREPKKRPVQLAELLREAIELVEPMAHAAGVGIEWEAAPGATALLLVEADPTQIQLLLTELLFNAIDSIDDGPEDERRVQLSVARSGRRIRISVHDSGWGIGAEAASEIFQAFHTTKPGSFGVGLAICRSIAEMHDGALTVETRRGPGAVFHVDLPVDGEEEELT